MASQPLQIGPDKQEGKYRSPKSEVQRSLFDTVVSLCYRNSLDLQKLNDDELIALLEREYFELKKDDPYVAIRFQIRQAQGKLGGVEGDQSYDATQSEKILESSETIYVGEYTLKSPSMKDVNSLLGHNAADKFFKEIHSIFRSLFGSKTKILGTHFKGGYMLIDHIEKGESFDEVAKDLENFTPYATVIFLKHVELRIKKLQEDLENSNYHGSEGEKELRNDIIKLKEAKILLDRTLSTIEDPTETMKERDTLEVNFAFGYKPIDGFSSDEEKLDILNEASVAANMSVNRKFERDAHEKRADFQFFDYGYLFADMHKSIVELRKSIVIDIDGSPCIDPDYQDYFYFEGPNNDIYMTDEAVEKYRKGTCPKGLALVIDSFYRGMNVISTIKPYSTKTREMYLDRADNRLKILKRMDALLSKWKKNNSNNESDVIPEEERQEMILLLKESDKELTISMKDRGSEISQTLRGYVKILMQDGVKLFYESDQRGFAKVNYLDTQRIIYSMFRILNLDSYASDSVGMADAVKKRMSEMTPEEQIEFNDLFKSISDLGFDTIRDDEEEKHTVLSSLSDGSVAFNASRGDESMAVAVLKDGLDADTSPLDEEIKRTADRVRAVFATSDIMLVAPRKEGEITDQVRLPIVALFAILAQLESSLNSKKNREGSTPQPLDNEGDLESYPGTSTVE